MLDKNDPRLKENAAGVVASTNAENGGGGNSSNNKKDDLSISQELSHAEILEKMMIGNRRFSTNKVMQDLRARLCVCVFFCVVR